MGLGIGKGLGIRKGGNPPKSGCETDNLGIEGGVKGAGEGLSRVRFMCLLQLFHHYNCSTSSHGFLSVFISFLF